MFVPNFVLLPMAVKLSNMQVICAHISMIHLTNCTTCTYHANYNTKSYSEGLSEQDDLSM